MTTTTVNMNQYVRVHLTEEGIQRFRDIRHNLNNNPISFDSKFSTEPTYEPDGSYRVQLWTLMRDFGDMCGAGKFPPFDMNIIVEDFWMHEETNPSKLPDLLNKLGRTILLWHKTMEVRKYNRLTKGLLYEYSSYNEAVEAMCQEVEDLQDQLEQAQDMLSRYKYPDTTGG